MMIVLFWRFNDFMIDNYIGPESVTTVETQILSRKEKEREAVKKYIDKFLIVAPPKTGISAMRIIAAIFGFATVMSFMGNQVMMVTVSAVFLMLILWGWGKSLDVKMGYRHLGISTIISASFMLLFLHVILPVKMLAVVILGYLFILAIGICYRMFFVESRIISNISEVPSKKHMGIVAFLAVAVPGILILLRFVMQSYRHNTDYIGIIIFGFCGFWGYTGIIAIHKYLLIKKYKLTWDITTDLNNRNEEVAPKKGIPIIQGLVFLVIFISTLIVAVTLIDEVHDFQLQLFNTPGTLCFAPGKSNIFYVLTLLCGFISASITRIVDFNRKNILLVIAIFLSGIILGIYEFYNYAYINQNGMYIRQVFWEGEKYYTWNQLSQVEYSWHYTSGTNKTFYGECTVTVDNDYKVNLWTSKDSRLVLDSILKKHNVPILRQPINPEDYKRMMSMSHRNPNYVNDLMLKIFPYSGPEVTFSDKVVTRGQVEFYNINAKTDLDVEPNSIIIPVIFNRNNDDFIYISIGKTFLRVKDFNGNSVAEVAFQADKKYDGPVIITINNQKLMIKLNDKQAEISGISALSGKLKSIGVATTIKYKPNI